MNNNETVSAEHVEAEKQEPVAWIGEGGMKAMTDIEKQAWIQAGRAELVETYNKALYTRPPQRSEDAKQPKREPLTLERIKYLVPHLGEKDSFDLIDMQIFARAIEAAHGITKGDA